MFRAAQSPGTAMPDPLALCQSHAILPAHSVSLKWPETPLVPYRMISVSLKEMEATDNSD